MSTGEAHSVSSLIEESCKCIGIDMACEGKGLDEIEIEKDSKTVRVRVDEKYFIPIEADLLLGNSSKAEKEVGWKPKTSLKELVKMTTEFDLENEKN
ncbi:MAG: GDP-mannose 4,6-dehydratase [Candidatus Dojkabacteria bacterium]|nr:GDP-mannose 4,6-dehydratase [Candidatus Dojkabacteria bacterium]